MYTHAIVKYEWKKCSFLVFYTWSSLYKLTLQLIAKAIMWFWSDPATESHLGNTICFRCCSDFQIPSPSLYVLWDVLGIWGILLCHCSRGERRLKSCRVPWCPLCPDVDRLVCPYTRDCWAMTSSTYFGVVKLWHPALQSMVPGIRVCSPVLPSLHSFGLQGAEIWPTPFLTLLHPLWSPRTLLDSCHTKSRQWGARTYTLGSCIPTYPAGSPVKLLPWHIASNFSWSSGCPRGLQSPQQSDLENKLFPGYLYVTPYLFLCS